jgi:hypothetical protein
MALIDITWNPGTRQLRQFGLVFLPLFAAVVSWWTVRAGFGFAVGATPPAIAVLVAGVAAVRPAWLRPVFVGWMAVAYPIGWVISHAAFALTYYVVITAIGRAMALAGADPLRRAFDRTATTYFEPLEPIRDRGRYFRQF